MTAPDSLLVRAVLCLYPRPWRDRYQDEFARLLVDLLACAPRRARIRLIVNAAGGAADAHLNLSGGNMADRIRSSLGVVVCALVVFAIAGSSFQKMTEYPDFTAAASQHSSIGTSFNVLRAAAVAAGIIVLAAAIPLVWTILRQAVAGRRTDLLLRLAVPPVAVGAWIGLIKIIQALTPQPGRRSGLDAVAAAWVIAAGAVAAALCAWATLSVLRRAELPRRLLRAEVLPMIAVVACMAAVTVTDLSWGLAVRAGDSPLFHSNNGLLDAAVLPSWIAGLVVLAAATIVAGRATARAAGQLRAEPSDGQSPAAG
jgi:hypothetical protein